MLPWPRLFNFLIFKSDFTKRVRIIYSQYTLMSAQVAHFHPLTDIVSVVVCCLYVI